MGLTRSNAEGRARAVTLPQPTAGAKPTTSERTGAGRRPRPDTGRGHRRAIARRQVRLACLFTAVTVATALLAPSPSAEAAGITTHGWMAVEAIDYVTEPGLANLLRAHEDQVRAGAMFPDLGYFGTNTYGEEAHWQRFVDAYIDLIAARDDCGPDLTDPDAPCADMIAHAFGVAGHGMGDEVWDWLFEPNGPDRNEYYVNGLPTANEGGAETQMDLVAVAVHGVPRPVMPPLPDADALLQVFEDSGFEGVTAAQFELVPHMSAVWDLETQWAIDHLAGVQAAMPWMSANMVTAPGGVNFAARAIAGYWGSMWGRLNGAQPPTTVSVTYPATGQVDVPSSGWVRSYQPGSSRGRGGAQTRITAVLTHSRPYAPATGGPGVPAQMAPGTMTITDVASGEVLPVLAGFPRSVPYGGDAGQHLIDVHPARDLDRCSWYEVGVGVTAAVTDARGQAVTPYRWRFRTECGPQHHTIHGTVTDPSTMPVAGAAVLAYRPGDGFTPTAGVVTGADGTWELTDLPAGSYGLVVVPPAGSDLGTAWLAGPLHSTAGGPVEVPGRSLRVDAVLARSYPVTGRVTDRWGVGKAGIEVLAFGPHDTWVPSGRTTTLPGGQFRLTNLTPGPYRIAFRATPAAPLQWYRRTPTNPGGATIGVGPRPLTGINHQLT